MTSTPIPQGGSPEAPLATCASMKSSWERFKAECDRTQSWDRPGTDCYAFSARASGCLGDIRLITPMPDQSMACTRLSVDEATLWQGACDLRQSLASPVEPGSFNCGMFNKDFVLNGVGGVCGNPAALVLEDQCLNTPSIVQPGPVTRGNPPVPVANVLQWGNFLIIDGLGLDGLGFGLSDSR